MFNKRKSLLLGILAAATATGLALGVNGVVDAYVGEPVGVNAVAGNLLATFDVSMPSGYNPHENVTSSDGTKWSASFGQSTFFGSNDNIDNYSRLILNDFISIQGVSATEKYKAALVCENPLSNVGSFDFDFSELKYAGSVNVTAIYSESSRSSDSTFNKIGDTITLTSPDTYGASFNTVDGDFYFGLLFESDNYFRIKNPVANFYEGESATTPDDAKPVSVTLDIGTGKNSFAQGEDFDPTGYSVTVEYASDSEPDYEDSEVVDGTDERLTWQFNSDQIGETDLSVTFNDGKNEPVVSNVVKIEITKPVIYDYLTASTLGLAGKYQNFNGRSFDSKASYSGNAMKNSNGEIQIRNTSGKDPSGIFVTSSDKYVVSINVSFGNNPSPRILEVYGRDTPYTSIDDFYGSNPGKLIYEFKTDDGDTQFAKLSGEYKYIAVRPADSTLYLDSIEIGYEDDSSDAPSAAVEFANLFLSESLCNDGVTAPDVDAWDLLGLYFEDISADSKEIFKTATANAEGTEIEQCVARYDYIVGKYGAETYNDFMGRKPAPIASALSIHNSDDVMDIAVISAIAIAGIAAAGAFVFLRRKKEA